MPVRATPPHVTQLQNKALTELFCLLLCQQVVLDLCRNDDFASPQAIQPHLSRINTYITNQDKEVGGVVKSPPLSVLFAFTYGLLNFVLLSLPALR